MNPDSKLKDILGGIDRAKLAKSKKRGYYIKLEKVLIW